MKTKIVIVVLFAVACSCVIAQPVKFDDYFINKTMRIDYWHVGSKLQESVILDRVYQQGIWAGNPEKLLYPFPYGRYYAKVYDKSSGALIFSKGYDGYFAEYKTTDPAGKGMQRVFSHSALIPYPRHPIRFVIERRDSVNAYHPFFEQDIDPADYHIDTGSPQRGDKVYEIVKNGDPHDKVDLVILSEGYTAEERAKFEADLKKYTDIFFSWEPYKTYKGRFNVYGVFSPSPEGGVDEPRQGRYRNTLLNATFNSMDSDRYLLTEDNKTVRDIAGQVPYDAILIMANSKRYGGGALFGNFSTFTTDGPWSEYVFLHEFGHNFAFLGDEYYTSDVSYNEFFTPGVEPTEPNLTALLDPKNLKWKDLVTPGIAIPTPWGQDRYDSLSVAVTKIGKEESETIDKMTKAGVKETDVTKAREEFAKRRQAVQKELREFMMNNPLRGKIGAFEGAGYSAKGLYRPTINSLMNQFNDLDKSYYGVNERAIVRMIEFYSNR
ncbi:MAG TPA: M64 family metallopeptidase [Bacteroidota bacterium]